MMKCEWILCPVCGSKTRNKIRKDTVLKNYPLYCPKCRQERLIKVDNLKITVMAYRVKAYTLREESTESGTRYFISFKDGQGKSHELEVSEQFFMEFRQMERSNRNLF